MACKFIKAWIGPCGEITYPEEYCAAHKGIKCWVCNEQATHECAIPFQFVCGVPLCAEHKDDGNGRHS